MDHYEEEEQAEPQVVVVSAPDATFVDLRDDRERQAYALLKDQVFFNTMTFDSDLLEKIGMDSEFDSILHVLGWEGFVPIFELGSRLLTIQFLISLREDVNGIKF